jgi:hypothetical protein
MDLKTLSRWAVTPEKYPWLCTSSVLPQQHSLGYIITCWNLLLPLDLAAASRTNVLTSPKRASSLELATTSKACYHL